MWTDATPTEMFAKIDLPMPEGVEAFSTLREAPHPAMPYSGFNTCGYTSDDGLHVDECRRVVLDAAGIRANRFVAPRQTHSTAVFSVTSLPVSPVSPEGVDAVVTPLPGVMLGIHTADCVPVVLADAEAGVIGAVHSGWRGTVGRIAAAAIDAMIACGARPEHISAAMGPAICTRCFEVGEEVAERFEEQFPGQHIVVRTASGKPHVDLAAAVKSTLVQRGVKSERIWGPCACPRDDWRRFFSARKLGVASGRTLTAIIRREGSGGGKRR